MVPQFVLTVESIQTEQTFFVWFFCLFVLFFFVCLFGYKTQQKGFYWLVTPLKFNLTLCALCTAKAKNTNKGMQQRNLSSHRVSFTGIRVDTYYLSEASEF